MYCVPVSMCVCVYVCVPNLMYGMLQLREPSRQNVAATSASAILGFVQLLRLGRLGHSW